MEFPEYGGIDLRLQAQKPIIIGGKVLGGEKPLICIPLTANNEISLQKEMDKAMDLFPDVIEWRVDYFDKSSDTYKVNNTLEILKTKAGDIPIIFTCRSYSEGGFKKIGDETRLELIKNAIQSGNASIVDIELSFGKRRIDYIKSLTIKHNVALIISYHNFIETPPEEEMVEKIKEEVRNGADIAKIAVMPNNHEDVLKLMKATLKTKKKITNPIITISMGSLGVISRVAGWIFGSDLTFAVGEKASASGQLPIRDLKMLIEVLLKVKD